MKVIVYHGTDNPDAPAAFRNHKAIGRFESEMFDAPAEFAGGISVSDSRGTAARYAKVALITLKVDKEDLYEFNDEEFIMRSDADYEVVDVQYQDTATFDRVGGVR